MIRAIDDCDVASDVLFEQAALATEVVAGLRGVDVVICRLVTPFQQSTVIGFEDSAGKVELLDR